MTETNFNKRTFLKTTGAIITSSLILPDSLLAKSNKTHRLNLYSAHAGKTFHPKLYTSSGKLDILGLFELDKAMMDYRAFEIKRTNFKLAKLLYKINSYIGFHKKINIHSGFRSAKTNKSLRRHYSGVAKHSLHIKGKAVDISVNGIRISKLKDIVKGIHKNGGIGYYPNSGFIHVDVGDRRSWSSYT